jgi:hypothetical protein
VLRQPWQILSRVDEARGVIRQIFKTEVDIKPDEKKGILEVSLHNLSNPYSDKLAQQLCTKLNKTETKFPGTNLRIAYKCIKQFSMRSGGLNLICNRL